jgi:hypothetical protein
MNQVQEEYTEQVTHTSRSESPPVGRTLNPPPAQHTLSSLRVPVGLLGVKLLS